MLKHVIRPLLGASLLWSALALPASAHPHVWVTYEATVVYDKGAIIGLDHVWTFDDMYTAMAIEGLDKNNDGKYDREELAELAKVNMEGLKDFDYFTYGNFGVAALKFAAPQDPWLEHKDGILRLHFRLPLTQPVLAEAEKFTFSIYDPSFFIAFEPDKKDPVKLASSAPKGCKIGFLEPQSGANSEELKAKLLNDAFAQQLGQTTNIGSGFTRTVTVSCAKS